MAPDRVHLTLPASKTDPFSRGITLAIAATGDRACAVSALHQLLEEWPAAPNTPLFSNIQFIHNATSGTLAAFHRALVVNKLRDLLTRAGVPGHYSGHSFPRRAATWARQAGIPDGDIQLLGRWKSDACKCCIEVHPEHIHSASLRLQTFSPQDGPQLATLRPMLLSRPLSPPPVDGVVGKQGYPTTTRRQAKTTSAREVFAC